MIDRIRAGKLIVDVREVVGDEFPGAVKASDTELTAELLRLAELGAAAVKIIDDIECCGEYGSCMCEIGVENGCHWQDFCRIRAERGDK